MVYSYIINYKQVKQNYIHIFISLISHLHWLYWAAGTECTVQERRKTLPDTGQELCSQPPTRTISHPQTHCSPLVSAVQNRNIVTCFSLFVHKYFINTWLQLFVIYPNSSKELLTFHWSTQDVWRVQEETGAGAVNLRETEKEWF